MGGTDSRWDNDGSKEGGKQVDYAKYTIIADKPNICRLVDANGYIKTWESWIIGDDQKKFLVVVGREYFDAKTGQIVKEWSPFIKIIGNPEVYYRGGLLETVKGEDGGKKEVWAKDPEVYNIVFKNNDLVADQGSWQAKKNYYWEVIPRGNSCDTDMESGELFNWSVDNKSNKYLKAGQQVFDAIKNLRCVYGDPSDYDISLTRTGSGRNNTKYSALRPDTQQNERLRAIVKDGMLSADEKAYVHVDLLKMTKVTEAGEILEHLSNTIRRLDELTGNSYYQELAGAVSATAPRAATSTGRMPSATSTNQEPEVQVAKEAPAKTAVAAHKDFDDSAVPVDQPAAPARGRLQTKAASGRTVICGSCKTEIDAEVEVCPKCKTVNLAPCDACGKPFSQWELVCPHCGQDYNVK